MKYCIYWVLAALTVITPISSFAVNVSVTTLSVKGKPLTGLVVYVEPLEHQAMPVNHKTVVVGQHFKAFAPYISVTQLGNPVEFINQDDITHHIYSAVGKDRFSFKIKAGQQRIKTNFSEPGEVAMGCNIHDWMSGYLLLLKTPYYAKTDSNGKVVLTIIQPGKYQLTVWHPQMQEPNNRIKQIIDLQTDKTITIRLTSNMKPLPAQKSADDFDFLSDY